MQRHCRLCMQDLPLRSFDLNKPPRGICRACSDLSADLVALERSRQEQLAELAALDAKLGEARSSRPTHRGLTSREVHAAFAAHKAQLAALEQQRRSVIAAILKIDATVATRHEPGALPQRIEAVEDVDTTFGDDAEVERVEEIG